MLATATSKITKRVRELAATSYDANGRCNRNSRIYGCYREVIVENGVAYKLARHDHYADHNRTEWNLYHRVSPSMRAMMAKPLAISSCGRVLAMEVIPSTVARSDRSPIEGSRFNDRLRKLLKAEGFGANEIADLLSDNHNNNIGVRENGELCWLDYASWGNHGGTDWVS
jgi:hypothetical protein